MIMIIPPLTMHKTELHYPSVSPFICQAVRLSVGPSVRSVAHNPFGQDIPRTMWPKLCKLTIYTYIERGRNLFMILARHICQSVLTQLAIEDQGTYKSIWFQKYVFLCVIHGLSDTNKAYELGFFEQNVFHSTYI